MSKKDVYEIVTGQIVDLLEAGTVPWHKPWDPRIGQAVSMSTRKPYRGINPFLLACSMQAGGYDSPWFGTYDQIAGNGGQVRTGEKSTLIVFWKSGVKDAEHPVTGETIEKRWATLRYFRVFNACQADGLPERFYKAPEGYEHDDIAEAGAILDGYFGRDGGPGLTHVAGQGAYYMPLLDEVVLPPVAAFPTREGYYSTGFHEAAHSTGHRSRLAREGVTEGHRFGDEVYSKEELVAEMAAAMLCGHAGIEQATIDRSAAYIASWVSVLKGDSKLAVQAAGAAQKACDLILGTTFEPVE